MTVIGLTNIMHEMQLEDLDSLKFLASPMMISSSSQVLFVLFIAYGIDCDELLSAGFLQWARYHPDGWNLIKTPIQNRYVG